MVTAKYSLLAANANELYYNSDRGTYNKIVLHFLIFLCRQQASKSIRPSFLDVNKRYDANVCCCCDYTCRSLESITFE